MKNSIYEFEGEEFLKYDLIGSANVGIVSGYFLNSWIETDMPKFEVLSADIPKYSRKIFKDERNIKFHISGYDEKFLNAFRRLNGETVERYASIMAHTLVDETKLIYSSIKELKNNKKDFLSADFINVYSDEKIQEICLNVKGYSDSAFNEETLVWWVELENLLDKKQVYVPAQMFFIGFPSENRNEKKFVASVSTGTASHNNYPNSLFNSLVELIQIHNFNLNWYYGYKSKRIIIDDFQMLNWIKEILTNVNEVELEYVLYQDQISDLCIVGCFAYTKDKKFPAISFGIQASTDATEAIKRATLECLSVFVSSYYSFIFQSDSHYFKNEHVNFFANLDDNVLLYADAKNYVKNKIEIDKRIEGEISLRDLQRKWERKNNDKKEEVKMLFKSLKEKEVDVYAMDITPPEIKNITVVTRLWSPQLFPVFLPSMPYEKSSLIKNIFYYPHPLA